MIGQALANRKAAIGLAGVGGGVAVVDADDAQKANRHLPDRPPVNLKIVPRRIPMTCRTLLRNQRTRIPFGKIPAIAKRLGTRSRKEVTRKGKRVDGDVGGVVADVVAAERKEARMVTVTVNTGNANLLRPDRNPRNALPRIWTMRTMTICWRQWIRKKISTPRKRATICN
jgi:hypothetical protein